MNKQPQNNTITEKIANGIFSIFFSLSLIILAIAGLFTIITATINSKLVHSIISEFEALFLPMIIILIFIISRIDDIKKIKPKEILCEIPERISKGFSIFFALSLLILAIAIFLTVVGAPVMTLFLRGSNALFLKANDGIINMTINLIIAFILITLIFIISITFFIK